MMEPLRTAGVVRQADPRCSAMAVVHAFDAGPAPGVTEAHGGHAVHVVRARGAARVRHRADRRWCRAVHRAETVDTRVRGRVAALGSLAIPVDLALDANARVAKVVPTHRAVTVVHAHLRAGVRREVARGFLDGAV